MFKDTLYMLSLLTIICMLQSCIGEPYYYFNFSFTSQDSVINIGDTISIEFNVVNTSKNEKPFSYNKDLDNIRFWISSYDECNSDLNQTGHTWLTDTSLFSKETNNKILKTNLNAHQKKFSI